VASAISARVSGPKSGWWIARPFAYAALLGALLVFTVGGGQQFIYFQF
jgi:hypothetical protein